MANKNREDWEKVKLIKGDSELRDLAMDKGIETMGEYECWFAGYKLGYKKRQKEMIISIDEEIEKLKGKL